MSRLADRLALPAPVGVRLDEAARTVMARALGTAANSLRSGGR